MKVFCNDSLKVVEIWVNSGTDNDQIKRAVKAYRRDGYNTVIYRSGTKDLTETTADLLHANI